MLENYHDINKADKFEQIFGKLYIGENPTPEHIQRVDRFYRGGSERNVWVLCLSLLFYFGMVTIDGTYDGATSLLFLMKWFVTRCLLISWIHIVRTI